MPALSSLRQFLGESRLPDAEAERQPTATRRYETTVPVSRRACAKVFTCLVDGDPIEAIVPASFTVNLQRLLALAGGTEIRPASVVELTSLSRADDAGILPASRRPDGQPIFVDVALLSEPEIVFILDGGLDATSLRWDEFARSARPIVGMFAEPPLLWARCRLSPSE